MVRQSCGEIPLGTAILAQANSSFILLLALSRTNLLEDKATEDSYYTAFRGALAAISEHNRRMKNGDAADMPLICPSRDQATAITRVFFPVYFPDTAEAKYIEALKFGHQVSVAISSYRRWLSCESKKKETLEAYRSFTASFDRKLRRGVSRFSKKKLEIFSGYLASGDLANRGLMDTQEIEWLVQACAFEGDKNSPFYRNRRLQRLGQIALGALLSNKHFQTGEGFQTQVRDTLVQNKHCFEWLIKMASAGSISFCPNIDLSDMGKLVRFARGGTSSIYRTKWNDETVAVKLFNDDEKSTDILQEISLMCLLRHPNLLPVFAHGASIYEDGNRMFCVSPYASRGSLYNVLHDEAATFDAKKRFNVLHQTALGIEYLHSLGLIHRDLKSLNILIQEDWGVYVADIGATRLQAELMTVNVGTPIWMAPEVFSSQDYSLKADIYSFAMIIYEVITGKLPFENVSSYEIPALVCKGQRPVFPEKLSKGWAKLVASMWVDKPAKRPSMDKVVLSLVALKDTPFIA